MRKTQLKVLAGGKSERLYSEYRYIGGEVTDTRLMGVLGLHLHWVRPYPAAEPHLHQFFYYDIEELGLETYRTYEGDDPTAVDMATQNLFGGLGARMVAVSEREGRHLVTEFIGETRRKKQPLPEDLVDVDFITTMPILLTREEQRALNDKMLATIVSSNQLIHYYLMRIFGRDMKGASLLCSEAFLAAGGPEAFLPGHATFLRNAIEVYTDRKGHTSYLCESLVETNRKHYLVLSELDTEGEGEEERIASATVKSSFEVTLYEASILLSRWEYVTVYEILRDPDEFDLAFTTFSLGTSRSDHMNGEMFMEFKRDNSHVNQRVFTLSDDICCLYYVTDFGQLVVAAYSQEAIMTAENRLHKSPLGSGLLQTAKYQFQEPVLFEFAQSDYEDFEDFLQALK